MQIRVVSLKRTPNRLELFKEKNSQYLPFFDVFEAVDGNTVNYTQLLNLGFNTDKNWRDPYLKRTLTKGEIGCFLSHWYLWEECARLDEPFLILEDDIQFTRKIDSTIVDQPGDLIYLAWNEMLPQGSGVNTPCYPYWTSAYIIKPKAAKYLIKSNFRHNIIPADEVLPRITDQVDVRSMSNSPCELVGAATETEPKSHNDYYIDFKTHVFYVASDKQRADKLIHSHAVNGVSAVNLWPEGQEWDGGLQNFNTGGGVKLNLLSQALKEIPDNDVVIFTDAYDVFFMEDAETIVRRFLSFKTEALFSAERYNWPDKHSAWPPVHTPYRYLCSGMFMGRAHELRKIIGEILPNKHSDQLYLQQRYLTGQFKMKLDVEQYIFVNHEPKADIIKGNLYNPVTKCYASIYHGNGGPEAKEHFETMYRKAFPIRAYSLTKTFEKIGDEMIMIDYKTPEQCQEWIDISERNGSWNPHPDDRFPSHDIHLKKLGLWEEAEQHWDEVVKPIIEGFWPPMLHYNLRKAFTMKYSPDTQTTLGYHCDSSMVTGSVKLNDDYVGATLHWPRQGVNNSDIPVGKMILFPSMVTHGHYVDELKSGTKYSATFWTARFPGEDMD